MSLLAPIYTGLIDLLTRLNPERAANLDQVTIARMLKIDTLEFRLTAARAALLDGITGARMSKLDDLEARLSAARAALLDAAITSRAPAAGALSTTTWTNGRGANLDQINAERMAKIDTFMAVLDEIRSAASDDRMAKIDVIDGRITQERVELIDTLANGVKRRFAVLESSGTWTVPEGIYAVDVTLVGGGGGAGGAYPTDGSTQFTTRGGRGGLFFLDRLPVGAGSVLTALVGAGGAAALEGRSNFQGSDKVSGASGGATSIGFVLDSVYFKIAEAGFGTGGSASYNGSTTLATDGAIVTPWTNLYVGGRTHQMQPYGNGGEINNTYMQMPGSGSPGVVIIEY